MPGKQGSSSKYSDTKMREAALLFLTHGNRTKAAQLAGIPITTFCDWVAGRKNVERWDKAMELAKDEADSDRQAMWHTILKATSDKMIERIDIGDPIVKDGEVVGYKPVTLRDVSWTHGVITDKLRVSEGKATSITGKSSDTQLIELAKIFDKIADKTKENVNINNNTANIGASKSTSAQGNKELLKH